MTDRKIPVCCSIFTLLISSTVADLTGMDVLRMTECCNINFVATIHLRNNL